MDAVCLNFNNRFGAEPSEERGTFVTNFQANELDLFNKVVAEYGSEDFVVSTKVAPPAPENYGGSLHYLGKENDIGDFWDFFKKMESELEKEK